MLYAENIGLRDCSGFLQIGSHMEINEVVRFHHSRVKFVTIQELHANNTRALMRDLNKIYEHL